MVEEMKFGEEIKQELAQCLLPLLKQLPPPYHQAVMWFEIQGLTQQEVARKQGITLSGAKSQVQRGRRLLKNLLLGCCRVELNHRGSIMNYVPNKECDNCKEKDDLPTLDRLP
jgi:RNA polymerase sigma-70 factor (ECF subfamily)